MPFDAPTSAPDASLSTARQTSHAGARVAQGQNVPLFTPMTEGNASSGVAAPEPSLDALVTAIGAGQDRSAFRALFDRMGPRLKAYLIRTGSDAAAAEELVQEVLLTVWRRAATFDPRQANASTWLFTIARNKRIDRFRREKRPELDPDDPALQPDPLPMADALVQAGSEASALRAALKNLPPEQSELLQMAYFEDKAHSAIAEERGLPLGTVKSRIRLALGRLRNELGDLA